MCGTTENPDTHELVLERVLDAPREKVWRCWSEPDLLKRWFAPRPWTVAHADIDLRPGGASVVTMRGPEGQEIPCPGVYLEVIENERLVFTDAYTRAWQPSAHPFMTAIVTFEDAGGGKTLYTARARHWTQQDRERHEQMGFHEGWGKCAGQLEAVARALET